MSLGGVRKEEQDDGDGDDVGDDDDDREVDVLPGEALRHGEDEEVEGRMYGRLCYYDFCSCYYWEWLYGYSLQDYCLLLLLLLLLLLQLPLDSGDHGEKSQAVEEGGEGD